MLSLRLNSGRRQMEVIDKTTIIDLRDGSHEAFERVFHAFFGRVKAFIFGYVKSEAEMRGLFPQIEEAIENTNRIAERCQTRPLFWSRIKGGSIGSGKKGFGRITFPGKRKGLYCEGFRVIPASAAHSASESSESSLS